MQGLAPGRPLMLQPPLVGPILKSSWGAALYVRMTCGRPSQQYGEQCAFEKTWRWQRRLNLVQGKGLLQYVHDIPHGSTLR